MDSLSKEGPQARPVVSVSSGSALLVGILLSTSASVACGGDDVDPDTGVRRDAGRDALADVRSDANVLEDATTLSDTGRDSSRVDAAADATADVEADAQADTGAEDTGVEDTGAEDTGAVDTGVDSGVDSAVAMDADVLCDPSPETVQITEVMIASEGGAGDRGEWFELRNLSVCSIRLDGVELRTGTETHVISSVVLPAGEQVVLGQSDDPLENHDLSPDYVYGTEFRFSNFGGSLTLLHASAELASVSWSSTDYLTGVARQLSRGAIMPASLGDAPFCNATGSYSTDGVFLGSPGAVNPPCF
ncbi:MAG: lamin tail domain-containing protein [Myxococcota bacterium]